MIRRFKVTAAEVQSWSTKFSITDLDHNNKHNSMTPEAFIHHLGHLCGKELDEISGLEFRIFMAGDPVKDPDDSLNL